MTKGRLRTLSRYLEVKHPSFLYFSVAVLIISYSNP